MRLIRSCKRGLRWAGAGLQIAAPVAVEVPVGAEDAREVGAEDHAVLVGGGAALAELLNRADSRIRFCHETG